MSTMKKNIGARASKSAVSPNFGIIYADDAYTTKSKLMGRQAAGVRGMRLKAGDEVVSVDAGRGDDALLIVSDAGYAKRTQIAQFPRKGRGGQGVIGLKITNKKGRIVAAFMVGLEDEIVAVASNGVTIRTEVRQISSQGRAATGVRLMNLDDGAVVASVAPILSTDDE